MLLTMHAATGALAGELSPNGWVAFALGFLSHFFLDMFPHGDRHLANETKATGEGKRYYRLLVVDSIASIAIFFPAFALGKFEQPLYAYIGLLAGLLPDLIVAIPEYALYIKKEYRVRLHWFYKFHVYVHDRLIRVLDHMPLKIGIAFQVLLLVAMWWYWPSS
ncbi:MAG: hypothetical protein Q7T01_02880 [bacterium]|nr:hypothetical protein [bacterium]